MTLHPIFYTFKVDGKWVNVTTLPMIYAAYPLFELGGDRAVLLLPMLGVDALRARRPGAGPPPRPRLRVERVLGHGAC